MPASAPLTKAAPVPDANVSPAVAGQAGVNGTAMNGTAPADEFATSWHDSSFDLRRGLWVIETDLDPPITHGIVAR